MVSAIISSIEAGILPGTVIPKPLTDAEHRVIGWGIRRGERALFYSIPNHKNPERPYAKAVTESVWQQAYEQLKSTGKFGYSWFISAMPECFKIGACNFTTIGGIVMLLGIAERSASGIYRKL